MADWLVVLFGAEILGLVGLLVVGRALQRRQAAGQVAYRLRFPRGLTVEQTVASVRALAVLPFGRRLPGAQAVAALEVRATKAGIEHWLVLPASHAALIVAQLRAVLPRLKLQPAERPAVEAILAGEWLVQRTGAAGATEAGAISRGLLAGLTSAPLHRGETVVLQWMVGAERSNSTGRSSSWWAVLPRRRWLRLVAWGASSRTGDRSRRDAEVLVPLSLRLGVRAAVPARAREVLRQPLAALRLPGSAGVRFVWRPWPGWWVKQELDLAAAPWLPAGALPPALAAGLLAWPIDSPPLPGLHVGGAPVLRPSPEIPAEGRIVGSSTFPGEERPLAIGDEDGFAHLAVVGPTGAGKSHLLASLILQDIGRADRAVVVVDARGDLIEDVLARIPNRREAEVIFFDATDNRPVGLNVLKGADLQPELVADQLVGVLHRRWASSWGPRLAELLHAALLTLAYRPGSTLAELPALLTSDGYRHKIVGQIQDPVLRGYWQWLDSLPPGQRAEVVAPALNKVRHFLRDPRLRAIVGQTESTISFPSLMDRPRILLVSLAKGSLGDEAAALLGSLIVSQLWSAIQGRVSQPIGRRRPASVYLDEFASYVNLPTDLGEVLTQARGYRCAFALAFQHLQQLPPDLKATVLANCRNKIVFQTSAQDATALAREFGPTVEPDDLLELGPRQVIASISRDGRVLPPATAVTLPLPRRTSRGEHIRRLSRERYGRDRAEVEAAIRARQDVRPEGAIGKKRRTS